MNPKKIMLFLIAILLSLAVLSLLSKSQQAEGSISEEGFEIAGFWIKYPTFTSITSHKDTKKNNKALEIMKEAEKLVEQDSVPLSAKTTDSLVSINKQKDTISSIKKDTLLVAEKDTISVKQKKVVVGKGHIYYPEDGMEYLQKFQAKLKQSYCKIIHYGDSQIEVDRITSYVRDKLQQEYGGSGPGFFPLKIVYDQMSVRVQTTGNWYRYAAFDRKQNRLPHNKYGLYTTLSRFTKYEGEEPLDSVTKANLPVKSAALTIEPTKLFYQKLKTYTKAGIHYGNSTEPVSISVYNGDELVVSDSLEADGEYHNYQVKFNDTPQKLKIVFEGKISPDFYGITLDADSGISMDNVPMRGASGRLFTRLDKDNFKQMSSELRPDIFIFQYGGNVIPYTTNSQQVEGYVRVLMANIKWVQRRNPKASILVIGPGDMATSVNGNMVSYPMVSVLDKEMRKKSTENGFAYWSLFETMGGKNSMVAWVSKGYAVSDYIHFSPKGARIMGELFYKNLKNDLQQVKND